MTAIYSHATHPGVSLPHTHSSPYQLHLNRQPVTPESQTRQWSNVAGPRMDPPRPLEPRPTHDGIAPMSSATPIDRRPDVFGYSSHNAQIARPHTSQPNTNVLPSVRDILSPQAPPPSLPPHDTYTTQHYQPQHQQPQHYQPRTQLVHPPVSHLPRPDPYAPHAPPQDRRYDLPTIETHPGVVHPGVVASPYVTSYRDHREHSESVYSRPRQQSASSYATGSVSSPYTPSTYDDIGSRGSNGYDRSIPPPLPLAGAEANRRYLGVREFPGEGIFHFFDNGHRLPTEVDGDPVNPQWGLTKANKPRKRLAVACLDCREKKIKCEPGATSCLQCEKAKRVCRRGNAASGQHDNGDWSSTAGSPDRSTTFSTSGPTQHEQHTAKRPATEDISDAQKRQKSQSPTGRSSVTMSGMDEVVMHAAPRSKDGRHPFADGVDPVAVDRDMTMQLIDTFLNVFNTGVYAIFPRESFRRWVFENTEKSAVDIMLLHAIMALAAVYHDATFNSIGEHCATLAGVALSAKFGKFSLQITQTRLLLALYSFAKGDRGSSWEHCGTAMRSISALRLNNEEGCRIGRDDDRPEDFGLSYNQIVECRRRTFWCGFMMDRLYGFYEGMLCTVDKADIYLRLPSADATYERGGASEGPFFDNGSIDTTSTDLVGAGTVSCMAHLALVISIWADVWKFVNRGIHRSEEGHAIAYEEFYDRTYKSLRDWRANLPPHLQYSADNIRHSVHNRYAGELVLMHILHVATLVKLNRCMRWELMPAEKVARNICEAHVHAGQVLGVVAAFNKCKAEDRHGNDHQHFSTPFAGYAVLSAIDVVSAGGHDDLIGQTIASIQHAQTFLHAQGAHWTSAAEQARHADKRFQQLRNIIVRPYKANSGCWLGRAWGMEESLDKELDLRDDCIYGVEPGTYFDAWEKIRGSTHLQHSRSEVVQER